MAKDIIECIRWAVAWALIFYASWGVYLEDLF